MIISVFCFLTAIGSLVSETKVISKVYLKFYLCKKEIQLKKVRGLLDKLEKENEIKVEEIIALKDQLCKH